MARLKKIPGLYNECFPLSKYASVSGHTVNLIVPPDDEGSYFITEHDVALKICDHFPHVLTDKGWQKAYYYLDLWWESNITFVEIQDQYVKELGLEHIPVVSGTFPDDTL